MSSPSLVKQEIITTPPVLIVDREGSIGLALYAHIKEVVQVVLVGGREPSASDNILYLALKDKPPIIPEDSYSHIFCIVESEIDITDLLPQLAEKASRDGARFLIIVQKHQASTLFLAKIHTTAPKAQILILGDIFGEPVVIPHLVLRHLFVQAKVHKRIRLHHAGLTRRYPIAFSDAITEILKVAFGQDTSPVLLVYPTYPVTELGIAHTIQKVDASVTVDFHQGQSQGEEEGVIQGAHVLPEHYNVFAKLQEAYKVFRHTKEDAELQVTEQTEPEIIPALSKSTPVPEKKEVTAEAFWNEKPPKVPKRMSWKAAMVLFVVVLLLLPFFTTLLSVGGGIWALTQGRTYAENSQFPKAQTYVQTATTLFGFAEQSAQVFTKETTMVGLGRVGQEVEERVITGQAVTQLFSYLVDLGQEVSQKSPSIGTITYLLSQSLTQANQIDLRLLPSSLQDDVTAYKKTLTVLTNLQDSLPILLGFTGTKTYLILFQNNAELRPGGGFIGSYALATITNGKPGNIAIHDVYDADGQLKGHIEPAFPVRRYLGNVHQYLRDSNFSLDFPTNASTAAFMLSQETGDKVDGVIGVDLSFMKALLKGVGSVYVPAYDQTVTPDNFFLLAETKSEKNFFPGSTQKKDFLRSVFTALQEKLFSGKNIHYTTLAKALMQAIEEKHMLIASAQSSIEDVLVVNGLSGGLWDGRPVGKNAITDTLGINEANIGVNKVNYYMNRKVTSTVAIGDNGVISENLGITYTNTSKTGEWPGGDYINYLRILVPKNSKLTNISIDGISQNIVPAVTDFTVYEKKNFVPPAGLEVATTDEGGNTVFGFLVKVPVQATKTLAISYTIPQTIDLSLPVFSYSMRYIKQPGTDAYPLDFELTYPPLYTVLQTSDQLTKERTSFIGDITTDTTFAAEFGKK